ncbi:MAG: nicotinate-nucleotide adenylyltransferase [Pseudomonadota bacterium]
MRLGLLGGTFDPIHLGHLRSAEEVRETFELDKVLFIVAASPPHKQRGAVAPFPHRFEMTRIALKKTPYFAASNLEDTRGGPSYSVETLRELRRQHDNQAELFFIVGLDAFFDITTWREYHELFTLTNMVVISRPGHSWDKLRPFLKDDLGFTNEGENSYRHVSGLGVFLQETTPLDVSSTMIRHLVREDRSIRFLVPEPIEDYIRRHHLYTEAKRA